MRNSNNIHYLTQDEMKRLLEVVKSKRDKAIFFLAYRHGFRASEIGLLKRTDVDLKKGRIYIQRLKGSYSGEYPLEADEIKILKSYLRTRKVGTRTFKILPSTSQLCDLRGKYKGVTQASS